MPLDFMLDTYGLLLDAFEGYKVYTVKRYLEEKPTKGFVILRHDVDRLPWSALRMAEVEANRGISSTYYFRVGHVLNIEAIRGVCHLGHEAGYHYEVLSKMNGDLEKAMELFRKELTQLRLTCEVKTISSHGRPLSRFDDDIIGKSSSLESYGILGDARQSIVGVHYYTDSGRSWDGRNSIKDRTRPSEVNSRVDARNTFDIIELLRSKIHNGTYLNVHPERWVANYKELLVSWCMDLAFNTGKKIIHSLQEVL